VPVAGSSTAGGLSLAASKPSADPASSVSSGSIVGVDEAESAVIVLVASVLGPTGADEPSVACAGGVFVFVLRTGAEEIKPSSKISRSKRQILSGAGICAPMAQSLDCEGSCCYHRWALRGMVRCCGLR
jgi:hypothetical protein